MVCIWVITIVSHHPTNYLLSYPLLFIWARSFLRRALADAHQLSHLLWFHFQYIFLWVASLHRIVIFIKLSSLVWLMRLVNSNDIAIDFYRCLISLVNRILFIIRCLNLFNIWIRRCCWQISFLFWLIIYKFRQQLWGSWRLGWQATLLTFCIWIGSEANRGLINLFLNHRVKTNVRSVNNCHRLSQVCAWRLRLLLIPINLLLIVIRLLPKMCLLVLGYYLFNLLCLVT